MSNADARADLTRSIIGIENRTAQEAFDIMCGRIRHASRSDEARADQIYRVLRDFSVSNMADVDGSPGFPLVDLVSNDPPADISTGEEQLRDLSHEIASELRLAFAAEHPVAGELSERLSRRASWLRDDCDCDQCVQCVTTALLNEAAAALSTPANAKASREEIARAIDPDSWRAYDNTLRPFAENRGAMQVLGESFWYVQAYQDGCRSVGDARRWWIETASPMGPIQVGLFRDSLAKADAVLALLSPGRGGASG